MTKNLENKISIESSWSEVLKNILDSVWFLSLMGNVKKEYIKNEVYPEFKNIFRAFDLCPFDRVKVVILGQDPYHNKGQADGLSFSVSSGTTPPPSLKNIYKEISSDCDIENKVSGDLSVFAEQGVLLLNSILTVEARLPASHRNLGWEKFTDEVLKTVSNKKNNVVFMLWGNYAKNKKNLIDKDKHLILEAAHPSPFSAYGGFFGCKHFSKTNKYLKENKKTTIKW